MEYAATIGFFDGVHRGHQFLVRHVMDEAAKRGLKSMVVTFDHHPRQVLHQEYQPELLTTPGMKLRLLQDLGVDKVVELHFDEKLASLTAHDFMASILRDKLNVRCLIIGYDNRFGHNRAEGFDDYVSYGKELGIDVVHNPAFLLDGVKVSSSVVRSLLKEGEVRMANLCLGREYVIIGKVVEGYKEGRKIGFPTANLDTSAYCQLVPKGGVYAVRASVESEEDWRDAMMDIGTRPTFDGKERSLEVNIFDFSGDIYGKTLKVKFVERVRDERKFKSTGALAVQLKEDKAMIRNILDKKEHE